MKKVSVFAITALVTSMLASASAMAQATPTFETVDGLRITEMTIARNIESGQAIDPTNTFAVSDGRVWVLIRVENSTGAEADIRVAFERADRELVTGEAAANSGVALHLPAQRRYRTQARTVTGHAGRYRVVVRTSLGNVLGTAEYEITG